MNFINYLKDKSLYIIIYIIHYFIILMMLIAFKSDIELDIAISLIWFFCGIILLVINYNRKKLFYNELIGNIEKLDQKYLVLETISKPNFYEAKLIYNALYEINKSMIENVNNYNLNINDFKEYIEMWIHEVKVPISTLTLLCHNNKQNDKRYSRQIKRLDDYIDQILYYVRSENFEKDFLIKDVKLEKIISNVALKNKDYLLENKIDLNVDVKNMNVLTDSKWLEFILNQIINNSIKYKKDSGNSFINITALQQTDKIVLIIYDNGIGISPSDLPKVFNKSFTGLNGRIKTKSTGMGLYIAKKLCDKLGHSITIDSEVMNFTEIKITFSKNDFYKIE